MNMASGHRFFARLPVAEAAAPGTATSTAAGDKFDQLLQVSSFIREQCDQVINMTDTVLR